MRMLMTTAVLLALALAATAAEPATKDDLKAVEAAARALNVAFVKKDVAAIKKLTTEDHVAVTPYYGLTDRETQIRALPDLEVTEYQESDLKAKVVAPGVVLVTYGLTQAGKYKGKPIDGKGFATSLWVKADGVWREASYTETVVPGQK